MIHPRWHLDLHCFPFADFAHTATRRTSWARWNRWASTATRLAGGLHVESAHRDRLYSAALTYPAGALLFASLESATMTSRTIRHPVHLHCLWRPLDCFHERQCQWSLCWEYTMIRALIVLVHVHVAYLKIIACSISEWITAPTTKSTRTTTETSPKELAEDIIGIKSAGMGTVETTRSARSATYYI